MFRYFAEKETDCKCGCGFNIESRLGFALDDARQNAGIPFIITSGARCKQHNEKVGGVDGSAHTKGLAVDIRFTNSSECFKIIKGLLFAGFVRIGINKEKGFIHADLDESKPQEVFFIY